MNARLPAPALRVVASGSFIPPRQLPLLQDQGRERLPPLSGHHLAVRTRGPARAGRSGHNLVSRSPYGALRGPANNSLSNACDASSSVNTTGDRTHGQSAKLGGDDRSHCRWDKSRARDPVRGLDRPATLSRAGAASEESAWAWP